MKPGQQLTRGRSATRWRYFPGQISAFLVGAIGLQFLPACAAPTPSLEVLNADSSYPEGAHFENGTLLYAEMPKHRIVRWESGENRVAWEKRGCGPTSIAPRRNARLLIACHFAHQVIEIDLDASEDGLSTDRLWPVTRPNDMSSDDKGGTYVSSSGEFSKRIPKSGAIVYIAADGTQSIVASDIWYANGVYFSAPEQTLYVSEHLGGRVLAYDVEPDGSLGGARVHIDISDHVDTDAPGVYYVGPDGLTQDSEGNLYVAIYAAGVILVFGPDASLQTRIPVPDQYITNLDLSDDEEMLYITAPTANSGSSLPGNVYRLKNPIKN